MRERRAAEELELQMVPGQGPGKAPARPRHGRAGSWQVALLRPQLAPPRPAPPRPSRAAPSRRAPRGTGARFRFGARGEI